MAWGRGGGRRGRLAQGANRRDSMARAQRSASPKGVYSISGLKGVYARLRGHKGVDARLRGLWGRVVCAADTDLGFTRDRRTKRASRVNPICVDRYAYRLGDGPGDTRGPAPSKPAMTGQTRAVDGEDCRSMGGKHCRSGFQSLLSALVRRILSILKADVLKSRPYAKPGNCIENDSVCGVPRPSFVDSALSGKHAQPTRYSRHRRDRLYRPEFDSFAIDAGSSGENSVAEKVSLEPRAKEW